MKSQKGSDSIEIIAFQAACLAIIVLNASCIGDFFYKAVWKSDIPWDTTFCIITAVCLNIFELMNTWATIKIYLRQYAAALFLLDILTLGIFFWQIHLAAMLTDDSIQTAVKHMPFVFLAAYCSIFFLYSIWNLVIICNKGRHEQNPDGEQSGDEKRRSVKERHNLCESACFRFIQALGAFVVMVLFKYSNENYIYIFMGYNVLSIVYVLWHNSQMEVFDMIIKPET